MRNSRYFTLASNEEFTLAPVATVASEARRKPRAKRPSGPWAPAVTLPHEVQPWSGKRGTRETLHMNAYDHMSYLMVNI